MKSKWKDWATFCGVFRDIKLTPREVGELCEKHQVKKGPQGWDIELAYQIKKVYLINEERKRVEAAKPKPKEVEVIQF